MARQTTMQDKQVNFRITPEEEQILSNYSKTTGVSKNNILRALVRSLEEQEVKLKF